MEKPAHHTVPAHHSGLTLPANGVDYSLGRPSLPELKAEGIKFVGRYINGSDGKELTIAEAHALHAEGFHILLYFEEEADNALGGTAQGIRDAETAHALAHGLGMAEHSVIAAAVDFELQASQHTVVGDYLKAFNHNLGNFTGGAYGGKATIDLAYGLGLHHNVQTLAWSGGQWSEHAAVRQTEIEVEIAGASCDRLVALHPFGGWAPSA